MTSQSIGAVFCDLCEAVDSPVSLGLWLRFKYSQKELTEVKLDPRNYNDHVTFGRDYFLSTLLKKFKGLKTGVDTSEVAIQKFITSEDQCKTTNKRLTSTVEDPFRSRADAILHSASRKISAVLGPFSFSRVLRRCEWTVGATLEVPRRESFVDTKMSKLPITVTRRALSKIKFEIEHDPRWSETILGVIPQGPYSLLPSCFKIVEGNRVTTVPKDSSTDRVIAVEPRGNIWLQKGVGNYLRGRLKKFGVDLSKQEINQAWASMAQVLDLCTVDLSSASDTISLELVYQLLPIEWAEYLDDIRSPFGELPDGSRIRYEKFSSMGNGFTFELESLIFWALCSALQDELRLDWKLTSVYGDDIIVPRCVYDDLVELFRFCGFTVNMTKSFRDGLFFESCGKHFFDCHEVTPVYQKELLDEVEAMRLGNRLVRWSLRTRDPFVKSGWNRLRRTYKELRAYSLPYFAEGDDGWILPDSRQFRPNIHSDIRCRVIRFVKKGFPFNDKAELAYSLRRLSWRYPGRSDLTHERSLEDRIGFLFHSIETKDVYEVESARFTSGWRTVECVSELTEKVS